MSNCEKWDGTHPPMAKQLVKCPASPVSYHFSWKAVIILPPTLILKKCNLKTFQNTLGTYKIISLSVLI